VADVDLEQLLVTGADREPVFLVDTTTKLGQIIAPWKRTLGNTVPAGAGICGARLWLPLIGNPRSDPRSAGEEGGGSSLGASTCLCPRWRGDPRSTQTGYNQCTTQRAADKAISVQRMFPEMLAPWPHFVRPTTPVAISRSTSGGR